MSEQAFVVSVVAFDGNSGVAERHLAGTLDTAPVDASTNEGPSRR